jgi:hypothetical protein
MKSVKYVKNVELFTTGFYLHYIFSKRVQNLPYMHNILNFHAIMWYLQLGNKLKFSHFWKDGVAMYFLIYFKSSIQNALLACFLNYWP